MKKKRMAKAGRESKQKSVAYQLIPPDSEHGAPLYARLDALVSRNHEEISHANARIAIVWVKSWKPDVDGRLTLGKCKKASDLDRELAAFDYVVMLNKDWWWHPRTTDAQRDAVLDHECCHMAITFDKQTGEPVYDDRGRNVFRVRKHTIEEFTEIINRHGIYKGDVEAFAAAVKRAEHATHSVWPGYTRLHETLKDVGVDVPVTIVATWTDDERREVLTWALLRKDAGIERANVAMSPSAPACLAAALQPAPQPIADASTTH